MRTLLPIPVTTVAILGLVLPGCGGPLEADGPPLEDPPAAPTPLQRILVAPTEPVEVPPWGAARVAVRLTELGRPVPATPVDFALSGNAGATRLSALRSDTDSAGDASVQVIAGGEAGDLLVIASADGAPSVEVPVRVASAAPEPSGLRILLAPPAGAAVPDFVDLAVWDGEHTGCVEGGEATEPALAAARVPGGAATWELERLEAGRVTLLASAVREGIEVAEGCVEGVALAAGTVVEVLIELAPRPAAPEGAWALEHRLELPGGLAEAVEDVAATLDPAFDAPDDPARWLVDRVAEEAGLSLGGYREPAVGRVAAVLDRALPPAALGLPDHLRHAAAQVVAVGVSTVADFAPGPCDAMEIEEAWAAVWFGSPERPVPLAGASPVRTRHPVAGDPLVLEIPDHAAPFPLGRLVEIFVQRVLWPRLAPGAADTPALFHALVGCRAVARAMAAADGFDDGRLGIGVFVASETTLALGCERALDRLGHRTDSVLRTLAETVHPALSRAGAARWVDVDADGSPDRIVGGSWCGALDASWGTRAACGIFEGARTD